MGKDRQQVTVAEPARQRRSPQRLVDRAGAMQLGKRDRLGQLAANPRRARRSRLDQPGAGAVPMAKNACSAAAWACGGPLARWSGALRVVRLAQHRLATLTARVPGDLSGTGLVDHGDDDLVAALTDPDPLDGLDQRMRDRVAHAAREPGDLHRACGGEAAPRAQGEGRALEP